MPKDLSLLRTFDLEKAKQGEPICNRNEIPFKFIAYESEAHPLYQVIVMCSIDKKVSARTINGTLHTTPFSYSDLRMAPLCWIEDKPVYKGDVLYWRTDGSQFTVVGPLTENGNLVGDSICKSGHVYKGSLDYSGMYPSSLTWTKPKQKKQGWINIYSSRYGYVHPTKELADANATNANGYIDAQRIACIEFEYEE